MNDLWRVCSFSLSLMRVFIIRLFIGVVCWRHVILIRTRVRIFLIRTKFPFPPLLRFLLRFSVMVLKRNGLVRSVRLVFTYRVWVFKDLKDLASSVVGFVQG